MSTNFTNEVINEGDILIRFNIDRFDAALSPAFKEFFSDAVQQECPKVVLDLSSVAFMDSSGLGALISSLKQLNSQGSIVLVGLQPNVKGLMTLTRMDRLFPQYETLEELESVS